MFVKKRSTSADVAERAGVSRTTVSYVLNGKPGEGIRISEATKLKVLEAAKELHYYPSKAAIALRTNRSHLIALMIPHIEYPFHPIFNSEVQKEAEAFDYDVIAYSTREDYVRECSFIENLISRGIDGVIIHSYHLTTDDVDHLVQAGVSVVIIGDSPRHRYADNIVFDEASAVDEVVSYFIEKGHTRIGTIAGPSYSWAGANRKRGYIAAHQRAKLPIDPDLSFESGFYLSETVSQAMERLMSLQDKPTAIFAASDFLAVHAMLWAQDQGYRIPEDIAIAGIDDIPMALMIRPRLTTVRKDIHTLGMWAVRFIMDRIESDTVLETRTKCLNHSLIIREST